MMYVSKKKRFFRGLKYLKIAYTFLYVEKPVRSLCYPFHFSLPSLLKFNFTKPIHMNSTLTTVGRIIFALCIIFFGLSHLTNATVMSQMLPSALSSVAIPLIYLTGVCLILAAVSFIIKKWARIAGILLVIYLILIILLVHIPSLPDPNAMALLIRDTAVAAGALMIAGMSN